MESSARIVNTPLLSVHARTPPGFSGARPPAAAAAAAAGAGVAGGASSAVGSDPRSDRRVRGSPITSAPAPRPPRFFLRALPRPASMFL
eukprot:1185552-Prorocentrum_minimum.AAC.1